MVDGIVAYINFGGRFNGPESLPVRQVGTLIGEADFMLGLPNDIGRGLQSGTWGRALNRLGALFPGRLASGEITVTVKPSALRWEYLHPWAEVENRQANFTPYGGQLEVAAPLSTGLVAPPGPAPLVSGNAALYNTYKKDFQPRVGLAWNPEVLKKEAGVSRRLQPFPSLFGRNRNRPTSDCL